MTATPDGLGNMFMTIPRGPVLGRYSDYQDAQKVVDFLADNDFPVKNVSIIGNDLKLVERVSGKLTYPKVALQGAMQGAMMGLFFGLIMMLFSPQGVNIATVVLAALLIGAVMWMIFGIIQYALRRGKRDFASTRQVLPASWDVIVNPQVAGQAQALLRKLQDRPVSLPVNEAGNYSQGGGYHGGGYGQGGGYQGGGYQGGGYQGGGYGQGDFGRANVDGSPTGNAGQYGGVSGGASSEAEKPSEAGSRASRDPFYADLEDGRPRFGVRREDLEAQKREEATPEPEQPEAEEPEADNSGTDKPEAK
ncbi:ECF transporter S component [Pseudoglutamicibacter cumminsii]|uniref:general stress protein n=1 Tax=Pseudoglutamicibacter cumminsii TaxID=156979 RepID=UPI002552D4E3|nr:general stress protein [Pseudoglutamicibacter cumminsii]MDK7083804.1 ECF transporter S component [Pseudoglutamicibacter cumminsii]